jgi:SAM-dependent methyltransferase
MVEALAVEPNLLCWVDNVQHVCPRCRAAVETRPEQDVRCGTCGFEAKLERGVYQFVMRDGPDQYWQGTYDTLATDPSADAGGYSSPAATKQRVAAFRRLCGGLPDRARILDVGCADGAFWQALFDRRAAIGVDFSLEMCVLARQRGMQAHQADALALPFADDQFDLVYGAGLVEHIEDLPRLFAELARVCRSGGRLVVGTANKLSLARQGMRVVRWMKPHPLAIMRRSIIMRTARELEMASRNTSLALDRICWSYFPLPWNRCERSSRSILSPLATSVYIRLVKQPVGLRRDDA